MMLPAPSARVAGAPTDLAAGRRVAVRLVLPRAITLAGVGATRVRVRHRRPNEPSRGIS